MGRETWVLSRESQGEGLEAWGVWLEGMPTEPRPVAA